MNEDKNMEDIKAMADPKCSRCYGRGRVGVNLDNHVIQLCRCVKKKIKAEEDEARILQAEKEKKEPVFKDVGIKSENVNGGSTILEETK